MTSALLYCCLSHYFRWFTGQWWGMSFRLKMKSRENMSLLPSSWRRDIPYCVIVHRCYNSTLQMGVHNKNRHIGIHGHSCLCPYLYYSIVKMLSCENVSISHWIRHDAISSCMPNVNFVFSCQHLTVMTIILIHRFDRRKFTRFKRILTLRCK